MSIPQRIPPDKPASSANRVLVHPNLWLLLVALGFGFTTWAAFLYLGSRARNRSWLVSAAVYGALLVLWAVLPNTNNSTATAIGVVSLLVAWIGGTGHAAAIKGNARRLRPSDDPQLEAARQRIERRAEGKRLAAEDHRMAREVGVGRPDLPGADDFGLVDVNHASQEALCHLPGITPEIARRIAETRESVGFFKSAEDLGISLYLSPSLVDEIREYAVFL